MSLSGRVQLPGESYKATESNQIELGLGIHGEAGRRKMELLKSNELVKLMFDEYLLDFIHKSQQQVCLMVNNLGGLSNLEMYLLVNDCFKYFARYQPDLKIKRTYCDALMTSLNMNGFSLTILFLENDNAELILSLLDTETRAPSWPRAQNKDLHSLDYVSIGMKQQEANLDEDKYISFKKEPLLKSLFESTLEKIGLNLIKATDLLNKLDSECGDGDCGSSLAKIAETILKDMRDSKFDFNLPHQVIVHLSTILENGGGSLSIILSLFASASAKAFSLESMGSVSSDDKLMWIKVWQKVVDFGLDAVCEYGKARPNQRSIVDPLSEIKDYINFYLKSEDVSSFEISKFMSNLSDVADKSAKSTSTMTPRVGRASYVDASVINSPDAGATAIASIIASIKESF